MSLPSTMKRQPLVRPVTSPVDELIEPFIVRRTDGRLEIAPKVHRVLSAHVGIERLLVREDLDELKVFVVGVQLSIANVWTPGSPVLSLTNLLSTWRAWSTNVGMISRCVITKI